MHEILLHEMGPWVPTKENAKLNGQNGFSFHKENTMV